MRDRDHLPAAGGKAAVGRGHSREQLLLPGLLWALPPFEDVTGYYKTNLSNILQSQLLHSPFLARALGMVRMAVPAGEGVTMSCPHPEAFAGRSVTFLLLALKSTGATFTHFLAHPTPLFIALQLHITSAFIVSDV